MKNLTIGYFYGGLEAHQGLCIMIFIVLPISPYKKMVIAESCKLLFVGFHPFVQGI